MGTFTLFQETYHRPTFARMHVSGPKSDYDHRLLSQDRAMIGGVDDVGIGALFGLVGVISYALYVARVQVSSVKCVCACVCACV